MKPPMNEMPRQKLSELIATHGRSLCDDPRRCEGLLRDYCGAHKREIHVLVSALKERVAADLLGSQGGVPREVLFARLAKRLEDNLGLAAEAAHWAVESWALALGVITSTPQESSTKSQTAKRQPSRKRQPKPVKKDKATAEQPQPNADDQPADTARKPEPSGVRVVDRRRVSSRQPASTEKRQELSQRTESVGSLNADNRPDDAGSGSFILDLLLALLFVLFYFVFFFVSVVVACLPLVLVLFALGIKYDQLGATTQVLLGILMLVLTGVVVGVVYGWLESALNAVRNKARAYFGLRLK